MRAWQFTGTHQPLKEAVLAEPSPAPGQVVLAVKPAGLERIRNGSVSGRLVTLN